MLSVSEDESDPGTSTPSKVFWSTWTSHQLLEGFGEGVLHQVVAAHDVS